MEDIQTTDPATRRIVHAALDRELLTHGMDSTGPIKDDLLGRVRILRGYRGEPTVRLIDDTRTLVPPDAYLDQVMNRKPDYVPPEVTYGTDANRDERQARAAHWRHNGDQSRRDCGFRGSFCALKGFSAWLRRRTKFGTGAGEIFTKEAGSRILKAVRPAQ